MTSRLIKDAYLARWKYKCTDKTGLRNGLPACLRPGAVLHRAETRGEWTRDETRVHICKRLLRASRHDFALFSVGELAQCRAVVAQVDDAVVRDLSPAAGHRPAMAHEVGNNTATLYKRTA